MSLSRNMRFLMLKAAGVPFSRRHDFMLNEAWTPRYISQYLKARRCWKEMQEHEVRMIRVFSYSRSGTHNYFSRFHYMPACFVLHENLFESPEDRHQLTANIGALKPIDLLALSVFGPYGLQDKRGRDITRVVLPSNRYLEYPCELSPAYLRNDYVIFYMRNFIRMLYSRQKAAEKMNKPRMAVTDETFASSAQKHMENMRQMIPLISDYPDRFKLVLHEGFCARPDEVLRESARFAGIPEEQVDRWKDAAGFFNEGFYSSKAPVLEDNQLFEEMASGGKRRIGGEKYNPVPLPSLERTMGDPVAEWMTAERLRISRDVFGKELADLWLNDSGATYAQGDAEVLDAMKRAVPQ